MPCTISANGLGIKSSSLIDTGANGYAFIDTKLAQLAEQFLGVEPQPLPLPCTVRGFDGKPAESAKKYIDVLLLIDGRAIKAPMIILNLGDHDIILGRKWAAHADVLVDCRRRRLIWPKNSPKTARYSHIISTSQQQLEKQTNKKHQKDANRRDAIMSCSWKPTILKRSSTFQIDQRESYESMEKELLWPQQEAIPRKKPKKRDETLDKERTLDLAVLTATAFNFVAKREENVIGRISIYEIDKELEAREREVIPGPEDQQPGETELQWLQRILPPELKEYASVFSKKESDTLPPHRSYDHKIQIEGPKGTESIGYQPLRQQSTQELREVKRFLEDNLVKGFIEAS